MSKIVVRAIALLLCGLIVFGVAATAFAEELAYGNIIAINSLEEFLDFAESCRLDSASQGNFYILNCDIDLTDTDFFGVPIFCGSFDGNGHTVSGLEMTADGSYQGLFRYLTGTAVVKNLTVTGSVKPGGSRSYVGGIAGSNAGQILNCSFSGDVSGTDYIGGIAGINEIGGTIENAAVEGTVHGTHFTGGIVGENKGQILTAVNSAAVNTTVKQNSVDISDITLDNLTGAESAITVTDIGGIAGTSSGTISGCVNQGDVGYQYMGYNIGGIAGSQSGYISNCVNNARIYGRKEVGGIVGQLEPYTTVSFETDTLQILKEQVADLSDMTKRASINAKENFDNIGSLVTKLENHVSDMENAADQLTALLEDPQIESLDDVTAMVETIEGLMKTISDAITGIDETVTDLYAAIKDTTSELTSDLENITAQVDVLSSTLDNASDNLGGSALDVSDQDTPEDTDSKVENCQNFGEVLGDLNVGGVVGAIGVENDLDPESDVSIIGEGTLNYAVDVRSVVLSCGNSGAVQARKQRCGGIVGWMSMGLVKGCINTGGVDGTGSSYVGGIVGAAQGYLRSCSAKCTVTGSAYVGGIAGEAAVMTDCRSMVLLESAQEKSGSLLGWAEDREEIAGNYYLAVEKDLGGIDGISYTGCAEPLTREDFLTLEDLNEVFTTVSLYFLFEDGSQQVITAGLGSNVDMEDVPAVPEKEGYVGAWEGLTAESLQDVSFNTVYSLSYTANGMVIESDLTNEKGLPYLLAQGQFHPGDSLILEELETDGIAAWTFHIPDGDSAESVRCLVPEGYDGENLVVSLRGADGSWREAPCTVSGSYLVVAVAEGDDAIRISEKPADYTPWIIIAAAVAVIAVAVVIIIVVKKLKKKKRK